MPSGSLRPPQQSSRKAPVPFRRSSNARLLRPREGDRERLGCVALCRRPRGVVILVPVPLRVACFSERPRPQLMGKARIGNGGDPERLNDKLCSGVPLRYSPACRLVVGEAQPDVGGLGAPGAPQCLRPAISFPARAGNPADVLTADAGYPWSPWPSRNGILQTATRLRVAPASMVHGHHQRPTSTIPRSRRAVAGAWGSCRHVH